MAKLANQLIASRYVAANTATTLYEKSTKTVWRYNGRIWNALDSDDLVDDIAMFCDDRLKDDEQSANYTMAIYKDASEQMRRLLKRAKRHVLEIADDWLSFSDCLLNPRTFETAEHSSERIATIHIDHDYETLAGCQMPMFRKYLTACIRDKEGKEDRGMELVLQEAAGYLLTPENAHKCFILYGDGGTGKSVFLDILRRLVTESRCLSMSLKDMTTKDFSMPALIAKRANIKDEEHASTTDVGRLKSIIAGEAETTRRLYGQYFTFRPKPKLYFGSNSLPRLDDFDESIRRRFMLIPFDSKVGQKDRILDLALKIDRAGEIPAIVHWALQGLKRLNDNGFAFTETDRMNEAMREFRAQSSSAIDYIEQHWERSAGAKTPFKLIYGAYCEWCKENNRRPVSSARFGRESGQVLGESEVMRIDGKIFRGYEARRKEEGEDKLPIWTPK